MIGEVLIGFTQGLGLTPYSINFDVGYCIVSRKVAGGTADTMRQIHGSVVRVQKLEPLDFQWIVAWEGVDRTGNPVSLRFKTMNQDWKKCIPTPQKK